MLNLLPKWMDSSDLYSVLKFSLKGWHDENMISIPGKREDDCNATLVVFKIFHLDYMHRPGLYATQQSKVSNSAWIIYPCLSDGDKHKTGEEKGGPHPMVSTSREELDPAQDSHRHNS